MQSDDLATQHPAFDATKLNLLKFEELDGCHKQIL